MTGQSLYAGLCAAIALYHLVVVGQLPTWFGVFIPQEVHRAVSIAGALIVVFWTMPLRRGSGRAGPDRRITWYDGLLIASALFGTGYVVFFTEDVLQYSLYGFLDTKGIVIALAIALPLFEAVRRAVGWALPIIILCFVLITLFQPYMPGVLYGLGYGLDQVLYAAYVGDNGIFGVPLGVAANIIIVFVTFGALMMHAGASQWFMDMALALTGRTRGGPAKAAVVASGMFGSISGSPTADAASTGIFTIPMMIRVGYTPAFAAGCEAVSATGGMILPPVMGAIVFVMAEWIEMPYSEVVIAAIVPALLYYLIVFVSVHFRAYRANIGLLPSDEVPELWRSFKRGWFFLLPFACLIYFLVIDGYPPGLAAMYTCGTVVAVSFLSRDRSHWLTPVRILAAFREAVSRWMTVAVVTAAVGILIGSLELSGVGLNISRFVVDLGGGNFLLTLVLIGIACLIVGMGLDALPAYVTLATLFAPALIQFGVSPLQAHLYVIYWGLASFFTPPTCLAVFVTAGIAKSSIWLSGWEALRLGIAAFLVPIVFVANDALLMEGTPVDIALAIITAVTGSVLLASGIHGYLTSRLNLVQRLLVGMGGLLLVVPGVYVPLFGLMLAVIGVAAARVTRKTAVDPA